MNGGVTRANARGDRLHLLGGVGGALPRERDARVGDRRGRVRRNTFARRARPRLGQTARVKRREAFPLVDARGALAVDLHGHVELRRDHRAARESTRFTDGLDERVADDRQARALPRGGRGAERAARVDDIHRS